VSPHSSASTRALSPVVGVVLLVALATLLAAVVGTTALDAARTDDGPPRATFALDADPDRDRIVLTHRGGDAIDVGSLRIRVEIDGEALSHQPPVPFFAATGFRAGPTGPFNAATDGPWRAGERAGLRLASTNDPALTPGSRVTVTVIAGEYRLAKLETRA